ncbi:MAG: ATP-binding protein [Thermodesulfobacteriota bacterium]|nr:ATP-binding protein [Thermodesulfobacteriota bacterium]
MKANPIFLINPIVSLIRRANLHLERKRFRKIFGLKAKITLLIILIVAGVLFLTGYLDFELSRKAHIDLYLDRNLYIAKQINIGIPDQKMMSNLPRIYDEIEGWLMSRRSLREIDIFLFSPKGWEFIVLNSKDNSWIPMVLTGDQIRQLKKDKHLSALREMEGEKRLEVIVPLHSGTKVIGGIRVISSLDEAESYLSKKQNRTFILTLSSILLILIFFTLFFKKLVGNPIQKLMEAMDRAEGGNLEAGVHIQSRDELGEMGRHFNQMIKTIREAHEQNIQLLSQVNRFNEELTQKVEAATSELAGRNEELELLNEALFESQRQLSQSEKLAALGQVTAMMAHQIGTPLNSISGYIQLMLQDKNLPSIDRHRLNIIESQLDRLTDSVRSLLSFTSQPKPPLKPLNVNDVLEELIHLSEPWFHTRNVKVLSSLSPDIPLVLGDATHLQTLFLNLITNALDAMPDGGRLTIQTRKFQSLPASENGKWVEISIIDTGMGIPEESKKKIFAPFFTTKRTGEGTGLGLSICEKIVKDLSGRLEVKSETGKGSTFFVLIPAYKGKEPDG